MEAAVYISQQSNEGQSVAQICCCQSTAEQDKAAVLYLELEDLHLCPANTATSKFL